MTHLFLQSLCLFIDLFFFFFIFIFVTILLLIIFCELIFFVFIDAIWSTVFLVFGCLLLIGTLQLLIDQLLFNFIFLFGFRVVLRLVITLN